MGPNVTYAFQVAVCLMLASMIVYSFFYFTGSWRDEALGWGVAIERVAFIIVLAFALTTSVWTFPLWVLEDLTWGTSCLIAIGAVGVSIGSVVMVRLRHQAKQPRTH